MLSDAKVATPATAATDALPPSVPPPGLLPIASVTLPANPVATLPNVSHPAPSTAGVMVAAAAASRLVFTVQPTSTGTPVATPRRGRSRERGWRDGPWLEAKGT